MTMRTEMAKLSLWIVQHQMNVVYSEILGEQRPTLPLSEPGNIVCANSTSYEWNKICPRNKDKHIYLVGNPPYSGQNCKLRSKKRFSLCI